MLHDLYYWLSDTGTMSHITHRQDVFATYKPLPKVAISGVGSIQPFAIAKGTMFLCDGIIYMLQLHNVLHIPNNTNSLLSLRSWEQQIGQSIHIKYGKITLLTKDGIAVARGIRLTNRLYQMSFILSRIAANSDFMFHVHGFAPTWEVWHLRFGHVSYTYLQLLYDKRLVDGFIVDLFSLKLDCVACTEAKHSATPYGSSAK